ncbi:hypothetical protein [Anaeromyxobacter sp. SG17]|uniref:hypothetical protein n=1 Tax=Anaeromyxobacter sp. SG17 TaxID=2925405 RepID=UPI001F55FB4F|nr:hypothetical protein [Anaeromyxobacter sp. SG17]
MCLSESLAALRRGIQAALFQLGGVPQFSQTDNSTAATHRIPSGEEARVEGHRRPFNSEYLALLRHFGMTPRTTEIGAKEQNGDVGLIRFGGQVRYATNRNRAALSNSAGLT